MDANIRDWHAKAAQYRIPVYMVDSIRLYIEDKIEPGSFLMGVLCNDLKQAAGSADNTNRRLLFEYVSFFYNEVPSTAWGSPARVASWLSQEVDA